MRHGSIEVVEQRFSNSLPTLKMSENLLLHAHPLPISSLESLKSKSTQIIESIHSLRFLLEQNNMPQMPSWPDILAKSNALLSQTHNFSVALSSGNVSHAQLALHPQAAGLSDAQLDNVLIPLLRTQQTTDVLNAESDSVRRLSTAVFGKEKPSNEDAIRELEAIKSAHDARAARALRAVTMLREKYDWKARVEVEVEEPEELMWDPRTRLTETDGTEGTEEPGSSESDEDEEMVDEMAGDIEEDA